MKDTWNFRPRGLKGERERKGKKEGERKRREKKREKQKKREERKIGKGRKEVNKRRTKGINKGIKGSYKFKKSIIFF